MAVTKRYVGSQIGPSGFYTDSALALADGPLAGLGGTGGVYLDGFSGFAIEEKYAWVIVFFEMTQGQNV
jgi:hypothetical protein